MAAPWAGTTGNGLAGWLVGQWVVAMVVMKDGKKAVLKAGKLVGTRAERSVATMDV